VQVKGGWATGWMLHFISYENGILTTDFADFADYADVINEETTTKNENSSTFYSPLSTA
jgi:hypothetical protein